ncbi:MAG: hypothetical protein AAGI54_13540 [Planctomycetota bacterium]
MSVGHKFVQQQMFRLMVFGRVLHPELFELRDRRLDRHGDYEIETWITSSGHVVRFAAGGQTLTEVCLAECDHLPEAGLLHALPCLGEKDFELEEPFEGKLNYVTSLQTENLSDNLYQATFREMQQFAEESGSLIAEGEPVDGLPTLSVVDTQKYRREFHVQGYHLQGAGGLVLRTQTMFEIVD